MMQAHPTSTFVPLVVGVAAATCTMMIHLLPVRATVHLVRHEKRLGHFGKPWIDMSIFVRVVFYAFVAHLIEMAFWGVLFMICGEFTDFGTAFYNSAVNYTSLGYGDLNTSSSWRLLGPLETANGTLLFGVSTAMIFTLMLRLIQARFVDLKD
jgi:hypothetical protein